MNSSVTVARSRRTHFFFFLVLSYVSMTTGLSVLSYDNLRLSSPFLLPSPRHSETSLPRNLPSASLSHPRAPRSVSPDLGPSSRLPVLTPRVPAERRDFPDCSHCSRFQRKGVNLGYSYPSVQGRDTGPGPYRGLELETPTIPGNVSKTTVTPSSRRDSCHPGYRPGHTSSHPHKGPFRLLPGSDLCVVPDPHPLDSFDRGYTRGVRCRTIDERLRR